MEKKKTDNQEPNSLKESFEYKVEAYVQGTTKLITLRIKDFDFIGNPPTIYYTTVDGRKGILFASTFKIEEISISPPSDKISPIA